MQPTLYKFEKGENYLRVAPVNVTPAGRLYQVVLNLYSITRGGMQDIDTFRSWKTLR